MLTSEEEYTLYHRAIPVPNVSVSSLHEDELRGLLDVFMELESYYQGLCFSGKKITDKTMKRMTKEWKLCKQWKEKLCEEVRRRKRDKEGVFLHNKVQYLDCHDDIGKFYSGRNPLGLHGIRV